MAKKPLHKAMLTQEALKIINSEGLDKLSMRSLAAALDVEAASLYYHVKNKDQLLQLIVDGVVLEALQSDSDPTHSWQEQLTTLAIQMRTILKKNPGMVSLVGTHPISPELSQDLVSGPLISAMCLAQNIDQQRAIMQVSSVMIFIIGHVLAEVGNFPESPTAPQAYYDEWLVLGLDALIKGFILQNNTARKA